jgi:hypothetical protein
MASFDGKSTDAALRLAGLDDRTLAACIKEIEEHGVRKKIPPPLEPATTVTQIVAPIVSDLPDGKELQALRAICAREYPRWCDSDGYVIGRRGTVSREENDLEYLVQFSRAILAISNMKALDKPDTKRIAGFHADTSWRKPSGLGSMGQSRRRRTRIHLR